MKQPPLKKWLLKWVKRKNIIIQPGNKNLGRILIDGWYIPTSTDLKIFWVAKHHRELAGAKYLSPTGKGLQPCLILHDQGLVNQRNINEEVLHQLEKEGLNLTEGVKGAFALSASGLNVCTIGGCNGGLATLEILSNWSIPAKFIQYIFADTDILTNPKVLQGYKALKEACPSARVVVHPPQNMISDDGEIKFDKSSPDDWIEEGVDLEIVFKKVKEVQIQSIEKYHQNFRVVEKNEIQVKRGKPNEAAIQWLYEHFHERLMYLTETSQFFYYQPKGYWSTFNSKTILDIVLSEVQTHQWSYASLENALKLVAPKFLKDPDAALQLFSTRAYIGFQNGVWDYKNSKLFPHDPRWYISGLLPFNYVEIDEGAPIQTLCPRLCAWIVQITKKFM